MMFFFFFFDMWPTLLSLSDGKEKFCCCEALIYFYFRNQAFDKLRDCEDICSVLVSISQIVDMLSLLGRLKTFDWVKRINYPNLYKRFESLKSKV